MIEILLDQAKRLKLQINKISGNLHYEIGETLNSLRSLAIDLVEPEKKEVFSQMISVIKIRKDAPYTVAKYQGIMACDQIISILENLHNNKSNKAASNTVTRVLPDSKRIFIVHGHDMENALRLQARLKDRYDCEPVILSEEPSKGRSIIEKFESEAANCSYAFILFTPDDFVKKNNEEYMQARPNVILELGWFYGRLGRDRVCILFRKGTSIPSDLGGIGRIEFTSSIDEKILDIESELEAARLI
jgi:predicted nucleotide-binding protein